jgi:NAD(P)-dependent dehydrogenase (short-subunit alcohol dehydrogenase family)
MSGAVMAASPREGPRGPTDGRQPSASRWPADVFVVGGSLTGFFWLTQRAIEMATRYGRHVVSVLATLGEVADPGMPAVLAALTNGGLTAATGSLAIEYGAYGIRVNTISLGRTGQVSVATSSAVAAPSP